MPETVQITYTLSDAMPNKVSAIRAMRGLLGLPLKEAKDYIEKTIDQPNIPLVITTAKSVHGTPDVTVMGFLNDLEAQGIITSINSPINDLRSQLVDLIKEATDAECFGLAGDIAQVCDKYFGLSTAYIRGDKTNGDV